MSPMSPMSLGSVREADPILQHSTMATAEQWKPSKQVKQIVLAQIFVIFATSLDMTILTVTLPTIAQALDANAVATFWIAASYLLASAVVQPLMASFADIFGRRPVIFTAMCLFTLGSIVCCVADNIATMLAGRTIQGIGGRGIFAVNLIILSDLIPLRERPKYISIQQLVLSIGLNTASIIDGAFVETTTWRWLFYINFPFCAIGLVIIPLALRYEPPKSTIQEKLGSIDWIGSATFIAGMTAFLVGITWGGTQFSWNSAATLVPLILGLAIVVATGFYERFLAKSTFLRLTLFRTWSAIAVYFCTIVQCLTLFSQVYFLTLWLIAVKEYTPLMAGVCLLAFAGVCIPSSGITGPIITRLGSYRWAIRTGWVTTTLSLGLLALLDVKTHTAVWIILFLIAGIGQGTIFIAHSVASQAACDPKDAAYAMAMYSFFRSLGLCLGVSLGGTIWSNFFDMRFSEVISLNPGMTGEEGILLASTLGDGVAKIELIASLAWAFRMLFATLCGISFIGLVVGCWMIKGYTLNRELVMEFRLKEEVKSVSPIVLSTGVTSARTSEHGDRNRVDVSDIV